MVPGISSTTALLAVNTTMFYTINWLFIAVNCFMLFKIRHINDKLKMRLEMGWIVKIYSLFTYTQCVVYLLEQAD